MTSIGVVTGPGNGVCLRQPPPFLLAIDAFRPSTFQSAVIAIEDLPSHRSSCPPSFFGCQFGRAELYPMFSSLACPPCTSQAIQYAAPKLKIPPEA